MRLFRYTRGEERRFLDSSFEPIGDGYAFYRHHFARGIPVTAEEREACLRPALHGSRLDFYEAIRGRPATIPRRSWWRSQRATLAGIPAGFGVGLILLGMMFLCRAGGLQPPLRRLFTAAGVLGSIYGLTIVTVRMLDSRSGRS
ncbi:MAG TPA: hypothetical protein VF759_07830 [Allosphingosinicella sp.]|jgi:hypothetical protein